MWTTLPGYDALTDDASDVTKFSFNSDWTDIVRVHKYGYVDPPSPLPSETGPTPGGFGSPNSSPWLIPVAHSLGFVPFVEARVISGNVIYDDHRTFQGTMGEFNGERCWAFSDYVKPNTWNYTDWAPSTAVQSGCRVGYIVYDIPVST